MHNCGICLVDLELASAESMLAVGIANGGEHDAVDANDSPLDNDGRGRKRTGSGASLWSESS